MADRALLCGLATAAFLAFPSLAGAADTGTIVPSTSALPPPARSGTLVSMPNPPEPGADQINANDEALGNPANTPVTGALQLDRITGGEAPPSLEALQDARPNDEAGDDLKPGRREQIRQAALTYGAQGGQAARSFAINEMLRHNEPILDTTFDFRPFVLPVGDGQTLMQPPIVSQAQMAFALNDTGTIAHESRCVFEITREAQLTSAAPNWRTYLVRSWNKPRHPASSALPHNDKEVRHWNDWVAEGWASGEKVADEIYLSDLSRLQRDITGMARYRVLLRAGRVEEPRVVFENRQAVGGGDSLHLGNRVIRITGQPGLQARTRVAYPEDCR